MDDIPPPSEVPEQTAGEKMQSDAAKSKQAPDLTKRITVLTGKIEKKLVSAASNPDAAKAACVLLKELRTYIHVSTDNQALIMQSGFIEKLVCLLPRCLDYRVMISDTMRCMTPFVRSPSFKQDVCELMCRYEFIKTLLVLLRRHGSDENISVQCMELIYLIIDHNCRLARDTNSLLNFIVMHGGLSTIPQAAISFEVQKQEVSLRRAVSCLIFMIKSGSDGASMAAQIGASCSFALVEPLLRLASERRDVLREHAVILLVGLMHGSDGACASVIKKNAIEQLAPLPLESQGLPTSWVSQARGRLESLGADARALAEEQPEEAAEAARRDSPRAGAEPSNAPSALLLSGKYNHDGYWPPLRPDSELGSGRRRPATGYDARIPGVVDRLFSSPIAQGTTDKEIRKVKASMNKKTIVPSRSSSRPSTRETRDLGRSASGLGAATGGLGLMANTIFNDEDRAKSPVEARHVQKLSYAEKLQVMIMQVQDTMKDEDQDAEKGKQEL